VTSTNQNSIDDLALLERMVFCRQFELLVERLALAGEVRGMAHLAIGQEATTAGIAPLVTGSDWINGTYRNVTLALCLGTPVTVLLGELLGRAGGLCGGVGGHMHLFDLPRRFIGTDPVVGSSMALGAGAALALKHQKSDGISFTFLGEGALGAGISHEVLNLAKLWSLPILFVVENNGYAISTPISESLATPILERAKSYGIAAEAVDGNDIRAVVRTAGTLAALVRTERAPALLEARTYRQRGHSKSDTRNYRSRDEEQNWQKRDPIERLAEALAAEGKLAKSPTQLAEESDTALAKALEEARAMPWPTPKPLVVAGAPLVDTDKSQVLRAKSRTLSYRQAIHDALEEALDSDPRVVLYGQDVGTFGGAYKASSGLLKKFGKHRVVDTPISELGVCEMLVGAAMCGMKPIFEVMFGDFLSLCADAIVNHAAKFRFCSGGSVRVPLIIRAPFGPGNGFGATHSQCVERWFTHVPGLIVAVPSTPADVKEMYAAALQCDDPVLILEPISLYANTGAVPDETMPALTGARVVAEGSKVTVVSYGRTLFTVLAACEKISDPNSIEVIDLRCLTPLDRATIEASVRKTGALLVVEDGHKTFGIGGEILASVAEAGIPLRRAFRLSGADAPVAFSAPVEGAAFPNSQQVLGVLEQFLK
jgi:2-oxoisovalerate dehydrogenase E1 component